MSEKGEKEYLYGLFGLQFSEIANKVKESDKKSDKALAPIFDKVDELFNSINHSPYKLKIPEGLEDLPDEYSDLALFIRGELLIMRNNKELPEEYANEEPTELLLMCYKAKEGPLKEILDTAFQRAKKSKKKVFRESWAGRREKEIEEGALTELEARAVIPTKEDYQTVFSRNKLFYIKNDVVDSFDKESGKLNPVKQMELNENEFNNITSTDPGLLAHVLHYVLSYYYTDWQIGNTVPIALPQFFRDNHIDPRKKERDKDTKKIKTEDTPLPEARYNKFRALIEPYEKVMGKFDNGDIYRFMTFQEYKRESETIIVSAPYLFEIARRVEANKFTRLIRPTIANEPNKAAQEIAVRIIQGLARRGTSYPDPQPRQGNTSEQVTERTTFKTDKDGSKVKIVEKIDSEKPPKRKPPKWTYRTKFITLINECPLIQKELEEISQKTVKEKGKEIPHPNRKQLYNTKLKQTFSAALRIVEEKTDAGLYFENLTLLNRYPSGEYKIPTKSQLNELLIYTFTGKNPNYILNYYIGEEQ